MCWCGWLDKYSTFMVYEVAKTVTSFFCMTKCHKRVLSLFWHLICHIIDKVNNEIKKQQNKN